MSQITENEIRADRIKHLEFIQATITRLANSCFLVKGWTLTLMAAFLALSTGKSNLRTAVAVLFSVLAFWILDSQFLNRERLFRRLFDSARLPDSNIEIFSMDVAMYKAKQDSIRAFLAPTNTLFYGILFIAGTVFLAWGRSH